MGCRLQDRGSLVIMEEQERIKFQLTGREKSELFGEGIITVFLLLLLNMSCYILLNQWVESNPGLQNGIFLIKMSLAFGPNDVKVWSWSWIAATIMLIIDTVVVYWRLMRRYRQMQLRHIIAELHYISDGHFDHRISFQLHGQMQRVVNSVNALVDASVQAMDEERRIEKSKDELITNVSHDIRTPLTSIIGYLGLIENKQYQTQADILKYVHVAFLKSKQMKSLVDDLFEYTKVRQTDTPLNIMQIDLGNMLEQLGASFELEAQKKQMTITVHKPETPLMMDADPEKLARVYNNLITNAFKYGTGGHNIYLSAHLVDDNTIETSVANDGEEIPLTAQKRIFDRFYRAEHSRSRETGGTGLGLAITQSIVELHHGTISVTSNKRLTSFVMHFPVHYQQVKD